MDMKVYEKTRYQNIYRNKKNKNYVIMMSKPVKTSISRIDNKMIVSIEEAIKIRDNALIKQQKAIETVYKENFDTLWDKYMHDCKYVKKQAYTTLLKKDKIYNKFLKEKIDKNVSKTNKDFWSKFIDDLETTDKQKNEVIAKIKSFINWCVEENFLINNPLAKLSNYKIKEKEMKFWLPTHLKSFLKILENDIHSNKIVIKKKAFMIKTLVTICFSAGDRIGETRALTFDSFDKEKLKLNIFHSINYDRSSNDFLSSTKTHNSQRTIDITEKVIDVVDDYRHFLEIELELEINDDTLLFFNHQTRKPYSDVALRKAFYYYCDKANVPKIRMYDLRHTYAATMMSEGKEAYLFSKRMGHKNISTTINKYGHLSEQVKKEVAQSTDKYI